MDMTLSELSSTNAALLAYRAELRDRLKEPVSREDELSAKTVLGSTQSALEKVQEEIRRQAETYR